MTVYMTPKQQKSELLLFVNALNYSISKLQTMGRYPFLQGRETHQTEPGWGGGGKDGKRDGRDSEKGVDFRLSVNYFSINPRQRECLSNVSLESRV